MQASCVRVFHNIVRHCPVGRKALHHSHRTIRKRSGWGTACVRIVLPYLCVWRVRVFKLWFRVGLPFAGYSLAAYHVTFDAKSSQGMRRFRVLVFHAWHKVRFARGVLCSGWECSTGMASSRRFQATSTLAEVAFRRLCTSSKLSTQDAFRSSTPGEPPGLWSTSTSSWILWRLRWSRR